MWPEPREAIAGRMHDVAERAREHGRTLDYGLRVHVIVRDTEAEAREAAENLVAALDDELGRLIRERAHDATSLGVAHQARARELADVHGYVEPHLWTGIGRARSGCGAALVGSADQVLSELEAYRKRWACAPSSSRATPTSTRRGSSAGSSCPIWRPPPCPTPTGACRRAFPKPP